MSEETEEESAEPAKKRTKKPPLPFPFISRRQWGALPGETPRSQKLKHPVNFVRFLHTHTDADSYEDCSEYMREVQKFKMYTGDTDITFNFVIGPDNVVYEGVGWKVDVGKGRGRKLKYLNGDSVEIGFVGDMEDGFMPTSEMFKAAIDVIKYGLEMNYISPTYLQIPMDGWRPSYFLKPHRLIITDIYPKYLANNSSTEFEDWVKTIWNDPLGPYIPIVDRYSWRARGPRAQEPLLPGPLIYVRFTYTGTDMTLWPGCIAEVRQLQDDHMDMLGYPDIAYNFLVGADGTVYEGRGWKVEASRPQGFEPLKGKCLDISYIGDFTDHPVPWLMINAGVDLIKYGVKGRLVHPLYQTIQYNEHSITT